MKILLTLVLFLASNAAAFDVVGSLPQGLGDGRYVQKAGDTMSGPLTLAGSSLTVTGSAFSVGGSALVVANGRVGIGTTDPASPLSIQVNDATAYTSSGAGNIARFVNTNTTANTFSGLYFTVAGNTALVGAGSINLLHTGDGSGAFTFRTRDGGTTSEKMRITSGGNVGIATTNPNTKLHISSGTLTMDGSGSPAGGYALCFDATSKQMGHCSTVVGADGTCTCSVP